MTPWLRKQQENTYSRQNEHLGEVEIDASLKKINMITKELANVWKIKISYVNAYLQV